MKRVLSIAALVLLAAGNCFAGLHGSVVSQAEGGHPYVGFGYSFASLDWEDTDDLIFRDLKTKQNLFYLQLGLGLGGGWEIFARGGGSHLKADNAFFLNDDEFSDDVQPFVGGGFKAVLFDGEVLDIGLFAQGNYVFRHDDTASGELDRGLGLGLETITEKLILRDLWEASGGIGFQVEIEGAQLYGGPFYALSRARAHSEQEGSLSGLYVERDETIEAEGNFGGMAGIRWPLSSGWHLDVEGQYRQDVTIGGSLTYPF